MAQMITKTQHVTCSYGYKCCGTAARSKAGRRSLKKRDRQNALKGES
jgi:hypothetical protein